MTQQLVMAVSSKWSELSKAQLLTSILQGDASARILFLSPLNVVIRELCEREELQTQRLHFMTYQGFLRQRKSLDLNRTLVVLDEFSFCLKWGKHPESFLYETLYELSQYSLSFLALSRESSGCDEFAWMELGFQIRELLYESEETPLVQTRTSPWIFLGEILRSMAKKKRLGLYCRNSWACSLWRGLTRVFPIVQWKIFSKELVYKGSVRVQEKPPETFFICSPLRDDELSFLFSRTCGGDFPKDVYVYKPFPRRIGKREKNVLKSESCRQKLRAYSSLKDLFKSATWWAHSF